MQFKVPQNIDMEDKIVGPFTLMQFLYLMIGGMIDYVLLQTLGQTNFVAFLIIGTPIAILTIAMAMLKINDIPFPKFLAAAILYMFGPKKLLWHKNVDLSTPTKIEAPKKKVSPKLIRKKIEKTEIEQLASVLDTSGWAALRDQRLKEFVGDFDKNHHILETPQQAASAQVVKK